MPISVAKKEKGEGKGEGKGDRSNIRNVTFKNGAYLRLASSVLLQLQYSVIDLGVAVYSLD